MIICFIRHGETSWNRQRRRQGRRDIPLNSNGRRQMRRCAYFLTGLSPDLIVSSPLSRARESAVILADQFHYDRNRIEVDTDLIERDFGDIDGMTAAQLIAYRARGGADRTESLEAVTDRMFCFLERLRMRKNVRLAVVVSHSAAIKTVVVRLTGKPELQASCTRNAGITVLRSDKGSWVPLAFNLDPGEARHRLRRLALLPPGSSLPRSPRPHSITNTEIGENEKNEHH